MLCNDVLHTLIQNQSMPASNFPFHGSLRPLCLPDQINSVFGMNHLSRNKHLDFGCLCHQELACVHTRKMSSACPNFERYMKRTNKCSSFIYKFDTRLVAQVREFLYISIPSLYISPEIFSLLELHQQLQKRGQPIPNFLSSARSVWRGNHKAVRPA